MTNLLLPDSVNSIGDSAFSACHSLTEFRIPANLTRIPFRAFDDCTRLTNVAFGCHISTIGTNAFAYCSALTSVVLPNSVTNIGYRAFAYCSSLTNVLIPASVRDIGQGVFSYCRKLSAINVEALNPDYISVDGILFDRSQRSLVEFPCGRTGSFSIPTNINHLGDSAFQGAVISNVTIPNGIVTIGDRVFADCWGLNQIQIPNGVVSIGAGAFSGCPLRRVAIPGTVTNIGTYAFAYCRNLSQVYFFGNAPFAALDAFSDITPNLYYLPGTSGWTTKLAGRPTLLWNPTFRTGTSQFGVVSGQFTFTIDGTWGVEVVVEASTNLLDPVWVPLSTNFIYFGPSKFIDRQWTNYPNRFYRFRAP
jgi:hypothetical protein